MKKKFALLTVAALMAAGLWTTAEAQTPQRDVLDSMFTYRRIGSTTPYELESKFIFTYNSNGQLISEVFKYPTLVGNVPNWYEGNKYSNQYQYDSNGQLSEIMYYVDSISTCKWVIENYPNGKIHRRVHYDKHPNREEWRASGDVVEVVSYTTTGLTSEVKKVWFSNVDVVENDYPNYTDSVIEKIIYTYNANGLPIKEEYYEKDSVAGYILQSTTTLEYDAQQLLQSLTIDAPNGGKVKIVYTKNADNTLVTGQLQIWQGGMWINVPFTRSFTLDPSINREDLIQPYHRYSILPRINEDRILADYIPFKLLEDESSSIQIENGSQVARYEKYVYFYTSASTTPVSIANEEIDIAIHPNPATKYITLSGLGERTDVAVFDLLGKQVMAVADVGEGEPISISNLSAGVYMVRVNGTSTKLIVK